MSPCAADNCSALISDRLDSIGWDLELRFAAWSSQLGAETEASNGKRNGNAFSQPKRAVGVCLARLFSFAASHCQSNDRFGLGSIDRSIGVCLSFIYLFICLLWLYRVLFMVLFVLPSCQISVQLYIRHALWPDSGPDPGPAKYVPRDARRTDCPGRGPPIGRPGVPAPVPRTPLELLGGVAAQRLRPCHTHRWVHLHLHLHSNPISMLTPLQGVIYISFHLERNPYFLQPNR